MFSEFSTIIALIALFGIGAFGWWLYQRTPRKREGEQSEFERHDHERALEIAKAQADLQRWSGPH